MKRKMGFLIAVFSILLSISPVWGEVQKHISTPAIFLPQNHYMFETVVEGRQVTHDYVVENKGQVPLTIEKVQTG